VKNELASGDVSFSGYTFDYATEWRNPAMGNLIIDILKARKPYPAFAGANLDARYNKATGETEKGQLRWIQLVTPSHTFDPDELFNTTTGQPISNGPLAACTGVFIDPCGNDGTDGGPFYFNSDEIATYTNGNDDFGNFNLRFVDFPAIPVNSARNPTSLQFELYLTDYDPTNKKVYFLDGIPWGFVGIPEPGSVYLFVIGLLGLVVVQLHRERMCATIYRQYA